MQSTEGLLSGEYEDPETHEKRSGQILWIRGLTRLQTQVGIFISNYSNYTKRGTIYIPYIYFYVAVSILIVEFVFLLFVKWQYNVEKRWVQWWIFNSTEWNTENNGQFGPIELVNGAIIFVGSNQNSTFNEPKCVPFCPLFLTKKHITLCYFVWVCVCCVHFAFTNRHNRTR